MNQEPNNPNSRRRGMTGRDSGLPPEYEQAYSEQYAPGNNPAALDGTRSYEPYPDPEPGAPEGADPFGGLRNIPRAQGGPDDTSVPSGADPSLDYDEALDDDYRAVLQSIAASRSRKSPGSPSGRRSGGNAAVSVCSRLCWSPRSSSGSPFISPR